MPVAAPGGQEADVQTAGIGRIDNVVDMVPIVVVRTIDHRRARGIELRQRQVTIGIRIGVPV